MRWGVPFLIWFAVVTRTVEQEEGPKENESGFANATDENVTDNASDTGGLEARLVCYPKDDIAFRRPDSCTISSIQPQRESGWPVHEDIAALFWSDAVTDWVQLMALGLTTFWLANYFFAFYVALRLWDRNPEASQHSITQGSLRHALGLALVVLWYFSAWGSPRRGGWFYGPYCPSEEQQEQYRLTFSFYCFLSTFVVHVLVCAAASMFHSVMVARALYPQNIKVVTEKKVPGFLQSILDACPQSISLHGEEPDVGFMWQNGRKEDLRLKTWKQELCKRHHNCVTIEIHIRPADPFSTGTIQSLGYTFYAMPQDMKPVKDGSVQVYQAVVRRSLFFQHHVVSGLFVERFVSNLLMLGFLHELHFQHFGVNSACVRLEKRVRMLPNHEIEKLCHDCYTLSNTHLSRVKDFRIRAVEGIKQAEQALAQENEEAVFRAFSLRTTEKRNFLQGFASEGQWSKCAEVAESEEIDPEEETPLRLEEGLEPSRLGAAEPHANPKVPANSPAASEPSESSLSVKDRWAKGKGTKEDWAGLMHKANVFVLRSYIALAERDPQIRYVEEATRAFIEAWDYGSLKEDPIVTQSMLAKVRSLFNRHLRKALACLDFQSVDDLRAAAEGSGGSGAQFGLLDASIQNMMAAHCKYLLEMAMAVGDRKALTIALVESSRLMGELPEETPEKPTTSVVAEEPAAPLGQPVQLQITPEEPAAPSDQPAKLETPEEPSKPSDQLLPETREEPAAPSDQPAKLETPEELRFEMLREDSFWSFSGEHSKALHKFYAFSSRSMYSDSDLDRMQIPSEIKLTGGDPWEPLEPLKKESRGHDAPHGPHSFSQLLQMARSMYREKLFHDSQQLLLSDAARELLGDAENNVLGESWMQQQLAVMRTKQVGSLTSRAKRELESPKFIRALQSLFDLTTRQVITRDRQGKLPTRLKVVKAKRSVNLDAYRAYFARRTEIETSMARHPPGVRLDDCLTTGPSGCYLTKELRALQGVWMDGQKAQWLVEGSQVFRVAAVAAQFLEPSKAEGIYMSEDYYHLKPVNSSPVVHPLEGDSPQVQFLVEVKKRVKDDDFDGTEAPQEKAFVKDKWHGWFDDSGDAVVWYCEKRAEHTHWTRRETLQGFWRVFGSFLLVLSPHGFREGAAWLDERRLGRSARRGCAWFDRELQVLQEEGQLFGEWREPSFLLHAVGELYPIWMEPHGDIQSTTFKGFIDEEGNEMCLEPVDEEERPALASFRPKRTVLNNRGTNVLQPFLSKMWAYRQLMSAELSVKELSLKANELWLFHGTRESAAECITENEFQVRMAGTNRGTMFGPGIYLADSVTKSDEYTDPDPTGLRTMILCRCTMGRAVQQEGGGRECMKVCHAGGFHSVKGRRAYNEYIVYDENQVYPEYIIWYRRVYTIE
ncbi:unnamed protein product [Durusdinium trenchii]|uniref:Poly [ADP-ribose] polymerase n=2 Tax=Durusdinium trenchii TaxID=1381693 RepID=A0ABP0QTF9_9DINO